MARKFMTEREILTSLGLFFRDRFLEPSLCDEIRAQMDSCPVEPAYVKTLGEGDILDEKIRSARLKQVSLELACMIRDRLEELRPDLETHFRMPLSLKEKPQFLSYEPGGHYSAHRDVPSEPISSRAQITRRLVSIVIFLNDRSDPRTYSGGDLILYGLSADPEWKDYGLPVEPETGLLVTFGSGTLHEVQPVRGGRRYTIACWFSKVT
jgi:predicted 2-oxoglutarate/Fe(II)-dependent dioxygenase YbiX